MGKSWRQKHDGHNRPASVTTLDKPFGGFPAGARLVVATPQEVSAFFRSVPAGETRTIDELRIALAEAHRADGACPMTTGILCRIAAEAAYESFEAGVPAERVAPFWRAIDPDSALGKKLVCGPEFIRRRRAAERRAKAAGAKELRQRISAAHGRMGA